MKYIKTFESHRSSKDEKINEIFGLNKLIGNLFKKAKAYLNKIKGGQEIEAIYKKYLKIINDQFTSQAKVDLNILAANELGEGNQPQPEVKKTDGSEKSPAPTSTTTENQSVSNNYKSFKLIKEDENTTQETDTDTDSKTKIENLKSKKSLLEQIIKKNKEIALKEMDNILKKYGGSAANPQLSIIINTKKDQFDLDFMSAQISYLEKAGDKTIINDYVKQRDAIANKIQNDIKNIDNVKAIEIKTGEKYIYKRDGYKEEEWKKLSPEDQKNPDSEGFKKLKENEEIGYAEIVGIEGDTVKFKSETNPNEPISKTKDDILGQANIKQEGQVDGQQEFTDNLKIVKEKNPNGIITANKVATLLTDPVANKEKIDQINQIIGEEK